MMIKTMIAAAMALCALAPPADAADFPERPIKLVVPTGPGGSMDAIARVVSQEAEKLLGQPVVIDNRPGAGNTMSAIAMLNAPPDGYTLGLVSCAAVQLPHVMKSQYDPLKDLVYISRISDFSLILATRADSAYKTLPQLIAASKGKDLFYGTAGKFNAPHLATLRLIEASGAHWIDVPFKSDSEAITALLAGNVDFIGVSNSVLPFFQSGKAHAIGIFGDKRLGGEFGNIPTVSEQGYPVVATCPFGVMGPKNLNPAIIKKLDAALHRAIDSELVKSTAERFGLTPQYADSAAFDAWARSTYEQDEALFKKLGKTPE